MSSKEEVEARIRQGCPRSFLRRRILGVAAAALVVTAVTAHTPYGQWTVYRQRNLFIVASRTDPRALALARILVEGLAIELPESHARMTRASDVVRIASLLATGQLDVAIISRDVAMAMLAGSGDFKAVGPVSLRALAKLDGHLLVTVESFKARHAYLLTAAVDHLRPSLQLSGEPTQSQSIPDHPGAFRYHLGEPAPEDAASLGVEED
jgi:hypothetical protein